MVKLNKLPAALRKSGMTEKLGNICKRNDVVFLAVFGSYVRGEHRRGSDVDVAIEYDRKKPKDIFDLLHLENEFKSVFRRKVDLGVYSGMNRAVRDAMKKDMRVLYEKR